MLNIADLLRNAPKGTKLYSPLFGEVEYMQLGDDDKIWIKVDNSEPFDKYGRYFGSHFRDAECLLFPSKNCRTWKGWTPPTAPKFKIGDWIVSDDKQRVYQITDISDNSYFYDHSVKYDFISVADKSYHLWSINDAKDGDIIKTEYFIFIFKYIDHNTGVHYYCHYELDDCDVDERFGIAMPDSTIGSTADRGIHFRPAHQQEKHLLLDEIAKSGYRWDEDKKELRKIQPHYDIANFKPFDKVLCRGHNRQAWRPSLYGCYDTSGKYPMFVCATANYLQCIPFNDKTKHLLGTTDMCPEEFINW